MQRETSEVGEAQLGVLGTKEDVPGRKVESPKAATARSSLKPPGVTLAWP